MKKNLVYNNRGEFASQKINEIFSFSPNCIISDIGAGFGHMQDKIKNIDAKWQPLDVIKKTDQTILWDVNTPAPNNVEKAGIIILLEVLEHMPNPLNGIINIKNHLEEGGFLILSVPNPSWSKSRLNLLLKGNLFSFQPKHLKEHHVFTPWYHIVEHFLIESGFEILEYAIIDEPIKMTSFKEKVKKMIEKYIEKKDIRAKGLSYGIVAKKNKN